MDKLTYARLLRAARLIVKRADEAEDLLQSVLLASVEAGRSEMSYANNRKWLIGALKKRALFDARTAIRRQRREGGYALVESLPTSAATQPHDFIGTLAPALRITALLALSGHTRREIAWLLGLNDAALRQRISEIRRRWRRVDGAGFGEIPGLGTTLSYGRMRQSMVGVMRQPRVASAEQKLASHDPDGHIFTVTSQNHRLRQQ